MQRSACRDLFAALRCGVVWVGFAHRDDRRRISLRLFEFVANMGRRDFRYTGWLIPFNADH